MEGETSKGTIWAATMFGAGIVWFMWGMENFLGRTVSGHRLDQYESPIHWLFPVAATLIAPLVALWWIRKEQGISENGVIVEALVKKVGKLSLQGLRDVHLSYEFDGKSYTQYKSVETEFADALEKGDRVEVEVDANRPKVWRFAASDLRSERMNPDHRRLLYHAVEDPEFPFWIRRGKAWRRVTPSELIDTDLEDTSAGLVSYPSGEILFSYGNDRRLPSGVHFMEGPVFRDGSEGFHKRHVRNGDGGVQIVHSESRSQEGNTRQNYSTAITNLSARPVRVTKFSGFEKCLSGIRSEPPQGYYTALQFREWFRVEDPEGWIPPGAVVCDPDNWGHGNGVWVYFFEDIEGGRFIATVPMEHRP